MHMHMRTVRLYRLAEPCKSTVNTSVLDPEPPDPHVFGPPGSGSFYHQAKTLKNDVNVPSKSNKKKKNFK
jgi:hypothetical protein